MALIAATAALVSPVSELSEANRTALCRTATIMNVQRNDLLKPENAHRWLMYLADGSLTLYNGRDEAGTIAARSRDATQPLFLDKTAYQSARTSASARIVRFGREQIDILLREQQRNAIHVIDVEVDERDNRVFDDILADVNANRLVIASPLELAERLKPIHRSVSSIPELAELIQSDPALSVHVVRAANRVDGASNEPTQAIRGAIARLGVDATQTMLAELFASNTLTPANEIIGRRLKRYTQRATMASAILQVLSQQVPDLKADVAALLALTSEIGELVVLGYANRHAELFTEPAQLASTIDRLRTIVSGWVLGHWDYPSHFVDAAHTARDWYRAHNGDLGYVDLMTAALLVIQAQMPDAEQSSIPSADNLLLARRLQQAGIDLQASGDILHAATSRIADTRALLKAS